MYDYLKPQIPWLEVTYDTTNENLKFSSLSLWTISVSWTVPKLWISAWTTTWTVLVAWDTVSCSVTNGTWTQTYDGSSWGSCVLSSCDLLYEISWSSCILSPDWKTKDSNCDKNDIVIWNQIWAWCNSTLGTWKIYNTWSCYDYVWGWDSNTTACHWDNTKENTWNSTYWVDNIWWKMYSWPDASSACPSWRHIPTDIEWKALEKELWCTDFDLTWQARCSWLWFLDNKTKNSTNNVIQALELPIPGYINNSNAWYSRGDYTGYWTSSLSWSYNTYRMLHRGNKYFWSQVDYFDYAYPVRCIKD